MFIIIIVFITVYLKGLVVWVPLQITVRFLMHLLHSAENSVINAAGDAAVATQQTMFC